MVKKLTFKILGMHCTSCAINIDMELEDTEGVLQSNTNYANQETEVKFDGDKIVDSEIINIIKKTGYEAQPI